MSIRRRLLRPRRQWGLIGSWRRRELPRDRGEIPGPQNPLTVQIARAPDRDSHHGLLHATSENRDEAPGRSSSTRIAGHFEQCFQQGEPGSPSSSSQQSIQSPERPNDALIRAGRPSRDGCRTNDEVGTSRTVLESSQIPSMGPGSALSRMACGSASDAEAGGAFQACRTFSTGRDDHTIRAGVQVRKTQKAGTRRSSVECRPTFGAPALPRACAQPVCVSFYSMDSPRADGTSPRINKSIRRAVSRRKCVSLPRETGSGSTQEEGHIALRAFRGLPQGFDRGRRRRCALRSES